jgi:4-hydroxy-tetrahydrodipicolinate reductase
VKTVNVAVYGVGPIGSGIVRLLNTKQWAQIVGAADVDEQKAGKDLGEVAGLNRKIGVVVSSSRPHLTS